MCPLFQIISLQKDPHHPSPLMNVNGISRQSKNLVMPNIWTGLSVCFVWLPPEKNSDAILRSSNLCTSMYVTRLSTFVHDLTNRVAHIVQSQIINLHGEQRARADRMMIVSGQHASVRSAAYLQRSKLMFDWPGAHLARLEYTWTDRVIYSHHWKKLLEQLIEEWIAAAWMVCSI